MAKNALESLKVSMEEKMVRVAEIKGQLTIATNNFNFNTVKKSILGEF